MPSPSTSLATLRPDLAGSFTEFDLAMDRQGFIAQRVLPVFEAAKASGSYGRIPIEQLLQTKSTDRASGAGYSRGKYTFTDASFACTEQGFEEPVDDREAELYAEYFDAEMMAALRARDQVLRNAEIRANDLIFNTTTWTGASLATGVSNKWDVVASGTPITDVKAATLKVWENSGLWPNAIVLTKEAFLGARATDEVKEAIASTGAGQSIVAGKITTQQLAECFALDHVIVAGSAKNTADQGQSASLASCWTKTMAMVCRVAETNDIREPCIGRTFHWAEDGSQIGATVETYRDETVRSDIARARHDVDERVTYTEMGHLLTAVL